MFRHPTSGRTLFDALPHVRAEELQPGDMLIHRGRAGFDEGGARPILRVERIQDNPDRVRIVQATTNPLFPDGENAVTAGARDLIALAPPYWTPGTRPITEADVQAARDHIGARAVR